MTAPSDEFDHHVTEAQRLMVLAESCDWTTPHAPYRDVAIAAAQAHATIAVALRYSPEGSAS